VSMDFDVPLCIMFAVELGEEDGGVESLKRSCTDKAVGLTGSNFWGGGDFKASSREHPTNIIVNSRATMADKGKIRAKYKFLWILGLVFYPNMHFV
jgi:hypothetical protein